MAAPSRGEVWRVDLEPVRGHEQGRLRPALVVSNDILNHGPAELVTVVPITARGRPLRSFLRVLVKGFGGDLARLFAGETAVVRERLLAMTVGALQGPLAGLVMTLQAAGAGLVGTLQALAEKRGAGSAASA